MQLAVYITYHKHLNIKTNLFTNQNIRLLLVKFLFGGGISGSLNTKTSSGHIFSPPNKTLIQLLTNPSNQNPATN
jgi:hypothetical protein